MSGDRNQREDGPPDFDREFTTPVQLQVRRRIGYDHDHGTITRFVVQLEYRLDDGWAELVRFDHDPSSVHGHDVFEKAVHMNVDRDGTKRRSEEEVFPPMQAARALTFAEEHLKTHAERYIERFER